MACDFSALFNVDAGDPAEALRAMGECAADPNLWLWALVFTVIGAAGGALIGRYKNAVLRDAIIGAALGPPLGWIVSLFLPRQKPARRCARCGGTVESKDAHCRHCGAPLAAA